MKRDENILSCFPEYLEEILRLLINEIYSFRYNYTFIVEKLSKI